MANRGQNAGAGGWQNIYFFWGGMGISSVTCSPMLMSRSTETAEVHTHFAKMLKYWRA